MHSPYQGGRSPGAFTPSGWGCAGWFRSPRRPPASSSSEFRSAAPELSFLVCELGMAAAAYSPACLETVFPTERKQRTWYWAPAQQVPQVRKVLSQALYGLPGPEQDWQNQEVRPAGEKKTIKALPGASLRVPGGGQPWVIFSEPVISKARSNPSSPASFPRPHSISRPRGHSVPGK